VGPDAPKTDELVIALATGVRYAHGRGKMLGLLLPANYDPAAIQTRAVDTKINEIDINFGVKMFF
jgi:hypothetical protein